MTERQLTRLVDDALRIPRLRLTRYELAAVIGRYPRHPGTAALRSHAEADGNPTRSDFEVEFLEFCAAYGLPTPIINHRLLGHEVDAYFPDERLVVECDGWLFHRDSATFESDRDGDAERLRHDIFTVRVTRRRIRYAAAHEAERLHAILARRRAQAA